MYSQGEKRFLLINHITIIALFILILAGGVVRSSGSGMGCPDWPTCFGNVVPPVSVSQLSADYQEKYVQQRVEKNQHFAKILDFFGYGELADRIREDRNILKPEKFNAAKTWTEYVNRLIGASTGLLLLACVAFSLPYLKTAGKDIFFFSLANAFLVGFQGWLGSIVVSTNLLTWIVTLHMLLALVILAISIYTYFRARNLNAGQPLVNKYARMIRLIAISVLVVMIFQITLGTEVREQIDAVASAMNYLNRTDWVSKVGLKFNFHRDMAILVFSGSIILFFLIRDKYTFSGYQSRYISYVLMLVIFQIITGMALSYLALPPVAQSAHILLASLMFGAQFYLILLLQKSSIPVAQEGEKR